MKDCRNVLQISEVLCTNGVNMEQKRLFSIPHMYEDMGEKELMQKAREIAHKSGTSLIAARRVTLKKKVRHCLFDFVPLDDMEIDIKGEWNISPVYDIFNFEVLHALADPVILLIDTNEKRMRYRINYYIDLVSWGMDSDEALNMVFS